MRKEMWEAIKDFERGDFHPEHRRRCSTSGASGSSARGTLNDRPRGLHGSMSVAPGVDRAVEHVDVLIVGPACSGIGAAHHIATKTRG